MATAPAIIPVTMPETLDRRLSVNQIEARRSAIKELMKRTMREDVDYGTIPGTPKPTLYKPGAEKLCSLFQLAPRVHVHDLSTPDSVRYQVRVELYTTNGVFCGEGIGTASSAESKYQWRRAVCREEYDATDEDRRRVTYKPGKNNTFYTVAQVRTEPEDADNTVLKMAKKRSLIDAVLTVTAASDIFTQDVEDLPDPAQGEDGDKGGQPDQGNGNGQQQQQPSNRPPQQQQPNQRTQPAQQRPAATNAISDAQVRRFHALGSKAGRTADDVKAYLHRRFKLEHVRDLSKLDYEEACDWAQGFERQPPAQQQPPQQARPQTQAQPQQHQREPGEDEPLEPEDDGITDADLPEGMFEN